MNPQTFEKRIKDIERALSQISGLELESYSEGSTTDYSRMGIEDLPAMRREIVNHLRGVDKLGYINLGGESYGPPPPIANPKQGVVYPESPMSAWKSAVFCFSQLGREERSCLVMQKAVCEWFEEEKCGPAELPVVSASDEEIRQSDGKGEYPIALWTIHGLGSL